jgi:hypothetical protein
MRPPLAFLLVLLVPGLGQCAVGRPISGALLLAGATAAVYAHSALGFLLTLTVSLYCGVRASSARG